MTGLCSTFRELISLVHVQAVYKKIETACSCRVGGGPGLIEGWRVGGGWWFAVGKEGDPAEEGSRRTAGEEWSNSRDTRGGMPPASRMKVRLLGWLPRLASVLAQISVMRESEPQSSKCTSRCMAPAMAHQEAHKSTIKTSYSKCSVIRSLNAQQCAIP